MYKAVEVNKLVINTLYTNYDIIVLVVNGHFSGSVPSRISYF